MKKISAVLLVLVLVGSVVFAGFTGSATTGFGYNLDSGAVGFIKQSQAVSVDVSFLSVVGTAKGEGDVYAEINATLDFSFDNADASNTNNIDSIDIDWEFTSAKIIGDNWYVGILESLDAPNFAKSAIENQKRSTANDLGYLFDENKTDWADVQASKYIGKAQGVEVGYADYVGSFGFVGNLKNETYDFYGTLATPEYELGDGLTLKAGASGLLSDSAANAISGSVKVAYKTDDYSASVASDLVYQSEKLHADVAVNAVIDPVTVDVYFATVESYNKVNTAVENLLSVKAAAKVMDDLTLTLTGKDLVNAQDLSLSAKYQVNEELAVSANGGYVIDTEAWKAGASAEYKTADYTAKVGGTYKSSKKLALNASIESTTLIPGATLKLAYAGDDLTEVDPATEVNGNLGQILASVKIAF